MIDAVEEAFVRLTRTIEKRTKDAGHCQAMKNWAGKVALAVIDDRYQFCLEVPTVVAYSVYRRVLADWFSEVSLDDAIANAMLYWLFDSVGLPAPRWGYA